MSPAAFPEGVAYREAGTADVAAMARLRAASWGEEEYWSKRIRGYLEFEIYPQKALKPRVCFVAVEEDAVVGLLAGHLTERYQCDGELEWIDVLRERRGSGIASGLLLRLAEWFARQNASRICVDVEPSNAAARRFYRRHGARDLNPRWMVWSDIKTVLRVMR